MTARHSTGERRVLKAAAELARAFTALKQLEGAAHPSHGRDVADAVHVVQRIVAVRLAKRVDPGSW